MKKIGLIVLILICFVGTLVLPGCELVSVNTDRDLNQIVAKVGDMNILKREYKSTYDSYAYMYYLYGLDPSVLDNDETRENMLDDMIRQRVYTFKAYELGLDKQITADEQKDLDEQFASTDDNYKKTKFESLKEQYKDQPGGDERAWKEALDEYQAQLDSMGVFTEEGYKTYLKNELLATKLVEYYDAQVTVGDSEIQTKYDSLLEEQKSDYHEDPSGYESAVDDTSTIVVYRPDAGFRRVKHILVKISEEDAAALNKDVGIGEIADEGILDDAEIAAIRAAALGNIQAKADEVLKKLNDSKDFTALLEEYSEDPEVEVSKSEKQNGDVTIASVNDPGYKGDLVGKDSTNYAVEFAKAAMGLAKIGDYTGLVATDEGYYIIQYAADEPVGAVPLSEVKDQINDSVLEEKKTQQIEELYKQWQDDLTASRQLVKYPERLKTPTVPGKK